MRPLLLLSVAVLFLVACAEKPLPIQEGFVMSQGDSIYYKTVGVGDPLVIIHGGPVLDHSYLFNHLMPLAQNHQLIFYDQRACGKSQIEIPAERMTFDAFVKDIDQIRVHLGLNKISVLGHSWGGLVAMHYAMRNESRIDKLILSNSMAPTALWWDAENSAIAAQYTAEDRAKLDKLVSSGLLRSKEAGKYIEQMMKISFKSQFYDMTKMDQLALNIPNNHALRSAVFMQLSKEMADYDLRKGLSNYHQPVLLIAGEIEPSTELYLAEFTSVFENAKSELIPDSGHFPFIEQPSLYRSLIQDFLD